MLGRGILLVGSVLLVSSSVHSRRITVGHHRGSGRDDHGTPVASRGGVDDDDRRLNHDASKDRHISIPIGFGEGFLKRQSRQVPPPEGYQGRMLEQQHHQHHHLREEDLIEAPPPPPPPPGEEEGEEGGERRREEDAGVAHRRHRPPSGPRDAPPPPPGEGADAGRDLDGELERATNELTRIEEEEEERRMPESRRRHESKSEDEDEEEKSDLQTDLEVQRNRYDEYEGVGIYKFHSEGADSFDRASEICEEEGAHLAIANSKDEADVFVAMWMSHGRPYQDDAYVGIDNRNQEGVFRTVKGDTLTSTNYVAWRTGEPNNKNGVEQCVSFYRYGGYRDIPCYGPRPFICELRWRNEN